MFKKIMVPSDLSIRSLEALKYAVNIARRYDGELTLLHIVEEFMSKEEMVMLRVSPTNFMDAQKQVAIAAKEIMEKNIEQIGASDVKHNIILRQGKPYKEIIKTAQELEMDLLVITTNGRTGINEKILGSTAEHIIRYCNIPVLTIRTKE